jgi:poly(beta-D-mannuronate) lyase
MGRGCLVRSAIILAALLTATPCWAADYLVRDQADYQRASGKLQPGDTIRLANGTWRDFRILFQGKGTATRPIRLMAETSGKVLISGASDLRLAGEHLIVSGLVFKDGHAPDDELIAFRKDSKNYARNSRLTEVVIDGFNQADRRTEDIWVAIYGSDNRVDHSYFANKGNAGVTLAVIRPKGQPEENRHRIDFNHFGPRPPLGSNGGETIRIGTSDESLGDSKTITENNLFDNCDGEVEIISIKSGHNIVRGNTILQSQGSIVLRHGNGNLVERNVILGKGNANTGGIRVINRDQVVRGNYLEGTRGTSFLSAIAVMNGVPNSAINRYHQVANARIEGNSFIDVARLTFGAGADAERTAPPVSSGFTNNLIASDKDVINVAADIGGVAMSGNVATGPTKLAGVAQRDVTLTRAANGLLYPQGMEVGAPRDLKVLGVGDVGPSWYKREIAVQGFGGGKTTIVAAGAGELRSAVEASARGDILQLSSGTHRVSEPLVIHHPLTISGQRDATIRFTSPTLFQFEEGGSVRLEGLSVSGAEAPKIAGNALIRTAPHSTIANYAIELSRVSIDAMNGSPGFDVIATTAGTMGDHISIENSSFANVSGNVVAAAAETGKKGTYSAERIAITSSTFHNVTSIANVLRGGTDESTFGPSFTLTGSDIAGGGSPVLTLSGVQDIRIEKNRFARSGEIRIEHSVGAPLVRIEGNQFLATPAPKLAKLYPQGSPQVVMKDNVMGEVQ